MFWFICIFYNLDVLFFDFVKVLKDISINRDLVKYYIFFLYLIFCKKKKKERGVIFIVYICKLFIVM